MGKVPEILFLWRLKPSARVVRSPISLGNEPASPLSSRNISFTFDSMMLQVTPYQEALQGSPDIQFALFVHSGPPVER